jgi:hypothetical protein
MDFPKMLSDWYAREDSELGQHENREPITPDSVWMTAKGDRIRVRDLEDGHLLNIIRCFRNKSPHGTQVYPRDPVYRREWLNVLANEAYSRGLTLEEPDEKDPVHE